MPNRTAPIGRLCSWRGGFVIVLMCLLSAGCGGKVVDLGISREKLDAEIAKSSEKPVLVDFWKFGCASCMMVDPVMDQLAKEYDGRVIVSKFMMEHFWFAPTDWGVFKRYSFGFFPTVILFVDGKERHRWVWNVDTKAYREVLDPLVGPAPTTQPGSTTAAATEPSPLSPPE